MNPDDVQRMTEPLREGIVARQPEPVLSGDVECDEVYVVAGHKGFPDAVKKQGRRGRRRRLKGARGRGTLEKEKPPIFGMIQRGGAVVIRMVENVQQATIRPLIQTFMAPGTRVHTDEYTLYNPLKDWGFDHHTVCHSRGEYARDEDGDGCYEIHVNTMEGFGLCSVPGCDRIAASRRRNCRCTWTSFSSCITFACGVKACLAPS